MWTALDQRLLGFTETGGALTALRLENASAPVKHSPPQSSGRSKMTDANVDSSLLMLILWRKPHPKPSVASPAAPIRPALSSSAHTESTE